MLKCEGRSSKSEVRRRNSRRSNRSSSVAESIPKSEYPLPGCSQRFLPNWHHTFHFIDEPLACGEGFSSMRCDNFDPQGRFVDFHHSEPMDQAHRLDRPALLDLIQQQMELMLRHALERFIFKRANRCVCFGGPDYPQEIYDCAHASGDGSLSEQGGFIDGFGGN